MSKRNPLALEWARDLKFDKKLYIQAYLDYIGGLLRGLRGGLETILPGKPADASDVARKQQTRARMEQQIQEFEAYKKKVAAIELVSYSEIDPLGPTSIFVLGDEFDEGYDWNETWMGIILPYDDVLIEASVMVNGYDVGPEALNAWIPTRSVVNREARTPFNAL